MATAGSPAVVVVASCSRSGLVSPNTGRTWKRVEAVPPSVILRSVIRPAGVKRFVKVHTGLTPPRRNRDLRARLIVCDVPELLRSAR